MAERFINIAFPFRDDEVKNYFLQMNKNSYDAIKSDLIHLLLTTPGDRLYLPDFGTNLRQYLFEPNDNKVRDDIKTEIQTAVSKYIPNLTITTLTVDRPQDNEYGSKSEHTAIVRIDYVVTEGALNKVDFITLTV
jgi:phage baseplate assembly protein W